MPQKEKLNAEEKVKIVRMYQRGEISLLQAAQYAGVGKTTINRWITRYKAVQEYLSGLGSLSEISRKYQLRSDYRLRMWIKEYNAHGDFNPKKFSGASGKLSHRAAENEPLADKTEKIHEGSPDKGCRRLNDDLRHDYGIHVNDKRVLRICRARDIRSTVKYNNHGCTRQAKNPRYLVANLLNRQFHAEKPNEKWLTDVTEFKWYDGVEVHKLYLSAILDFCYRRIVSYVLSERNDNPLVYKTFNQAVKAIPGCPSLIP